MSIVLPPREVFETDPEAIIHDTTERMAQKGYGFGGWTETRCPPEGGMYAYYEGLLYPYKGHPWAEAVDANNKLKRYTLSLVKPFSHKYLLLPFIGFTLTPWKWKVKFIEGWIEEYWRLYCEVMKNGTHSYTLKESYYNNCSRELWKIIRIFLTKIGVSEVVANHAGEIVATMIEWDDCYRLRLEDAFTETNLGKMLENPRREVYHMLYIMSQRGLDGGYSHSKFKAFGLLFSGALLLPKFKKAFLNTLYNVNFSKLQLDKIDYYHVLYRYDYKYLGRELLDRQEERRKIEVLSQIVTSNN